MCEDIIPICQNVVKDENRVLNPVKEKHFADIVLRHYNTD